MTARIIDAPAKINLGLEILGRRDDGYHEIRTIMCAISLVDTITFEPSAGAGDEMVTLGFDPRVRDADNLVVRALRAMRASGAVIAPQRVNVNKRIPTPSGLGGASSDAAATLIAFGSELRENGIDERAIAASLGSDVPFFLNGAVAMASGRGEVLRPLIRPARDAWVMLVTPRVEMAEKTRALYAAIDPAWWTGGEEVAEIASRLPSLPTSAPQNVFERAIAKAFPALGRGKTLLLAAGAPWVALSGAGPTYYTIVSGVERARSIANRVSDPDAAVNVARLGWTRDDDG